MNEVLLDRMVDGELSPDDQRELLARIDDEPGGWRRLALAFVESQALRCDLVAINPAPASGRVHPGGVPQTTAPWSRLLALAASLAVAFGIGLFTRDFSRGGSRQDTPVQSVASDRLNPALPVDDEALRLVDLSEVSPDWVRSSPNIVPPRIRHDLERSGYRVEQQRLFVPLLLENGQPAVVPIDEAEVQFIGHPIIQ
jgi:hypothetical protein